MARVKELHIEILDLYEEHQLSPEEIAPIVAVPQEYVEQVIADYESWIEHASEVVDNCF